MSKTSWRRGIGTALVVIAAMVGCSSTDEGARGREKIGSSSSAIIGTQRDASMYKEAVLVSVNNDDEDFCSGVLVAPRVVLTASHCVSFNPNDGGTNGAGQKHGTWSVTAPFVSGGSQTATASSGEPFDPIFLSLNVDSYDSYDENFHDLGFVYLDTAITGFTPPSFSSTLYPNGTSVSAVGRSAVEADATLVLSEPVTLLGIDTSFYVNDNHTSRITDGGDSGGPLFLDGTHTMVGTETRFDPDNDLDYWLNFSAQVVSVIQRMISQHGGTTNDPIFDFQEMAATALCARSATCCAAKTSGYVGSPTSCRDDYLQLGFDGTARNLLAANRSNVSVVSASVSTCLTAIGNTASCTTTSTGSPTSGRNASELASCIAAVAGKAATGATCVSSAECATTAVCQHAADGTASCQPLHASGASCEVLDKSGSEDLRYDLAQELCSNRAGGATNLYCDGYDFTAGAYKTESTWICKASTTTAGAACGTDTACQTSKICAAVDATTGPLTCVTSTPFVNSDVCTSFQ